MTVLVGVIAGFGSGRLVWTMLRSSFDDPAFLRANWRGSLVPTGAGIVLVIVVLLAEAVRAVAVVAEIGGEGPPGPARTATLVLALGLGALGLLDDLATGRSAGSGNGRRRGGAEPKGFRGHLGALAAGRLTTGGLKLLGGAAVALVVTAPFAFSIGRLLADAALVALAANLANLLDRAPGRTLKVGSLAFVVLALATAAPPRLVNVAVVAGAALALLGDDLRERLMLGDAGANVLGGVLALGLVMVAPPVARLAALVVVGGLNLASEWVSFSRVIEAVPLLRAADRAGRAPD